MHSLFFQCFGGNPEEIQKLLAVDPADARDPYVLYGNRNSPSFSLKDKWKNELVIPNGMLYRRGEPAAVHELVFSISDFLRITQKAESSVSALLTILMGEAIVRTYKGEGRLLTGAGAFNCRSMFHSRTPRSFSQSFLTVLHLYERHMDLDTQLSVQRARMFVELEEGTIARSLAERKKQADRMLENPGRYIFDQERLDAERRASAGLSTYFLSYLGHMDVEPALEDCIEDFGADGTVTRVPITAAVYEWRGLLHFRVQEAGCKTSIAPAIQEIANAKGIPCRMTASFEIRHDTFPLEELYHD